MVELMIDVLDLDKDSVYKMLDHIGVTTIKDVKHVVSADKEYYCAVVNDSLFFVFWRMDNKHVGLHRINSNIINKEF